jgi:hypothetical protein
MSDMEKNETECLLYEELKGDEKTLLQWYRENPLSVYIEIALLKLFSLGIITEDEYRNYQSEVVKKADMLKESC